MIFSVAYASEAAAHAAGHGLLQDPTFWVGVSFCLTVVVLAKPLGKAMGAALDKRSAEIAQRLEQAKKLRDEAEALLLNYKKKQEEAQKEIEKILLKAEETAKKEAREEKEAFDAALKRREEMLLARLARSQENAIEEVRNQAVLISIASVERLLKEMLDDRMDQKILEKTIDSLPEILSKKVS